MTDPGPPWWQYAAKAVAAFAAAVVVNTTIIVAAVQDGQVTTTEKLTIGLAILGALVAPAAVYVVPNRPAPPQ